MFVYFELVNSYWKVSDLENVRMGYCQLEDIFRNSQLNVLTIHYKRSKIFSKFSMPRVFHKRC